MTYAYFHLSDNGKPFSVLVEDVRARNGRIELLTYLVSPFGCRLSRRWRKVCGKDVFIPKLNRCAIDEHNLHITIKTPFTNRTMFAYLEDIIWIEESV